MATTDETRDAPAAAEAAELSRHVVVCGLNRLGVRTVESLVGFGEQVCVIVGPGEATLGDGNRRPAEAVPGAAPGQVTAVAGDARSADLLRRAGIERADALVLTDDDDAGNLAIALTAHELNPHLRIVMRMFNAALDRRLEPLLGNCRVIGKAALAAPTLTALTLGMNERFRVEALGRWLVVAPIAADPSWHELLRWNQHVLEDDAATPVGAPSLAIFDAGPADALGARRGRERLASLRTSGVATLAGVLVGDRRLRVLVALLATVVLASAAIYANSQQVDVLSALLLTVTVITSAGFGDVDVNAASTPVKAFTIALMVGGAAALATIFALVTDAIVSDRVSRATGTPPRRRMRGHVVVCGLGTVGVRLVERLVDAGVRCVALDVDADTPFAQAARRMGAAVVEGDVRHPATLRSIGAHRAAAVVLATDDDMANIEAALTVREINADARVVLRIFDPDLAARIERQLGLGPSRSVSAIAGPHFAAAATTRGAIATIPGSDGLLVLARIEVHEGSDAAAMTVGDLERVTGGALVTTDQSDALVREHPGRVVHAGDTVLVLAPQQGLARIASLAAHPDEPIAAPAAH